MNFGSMKLGILRNGGILGGEGVPSPNYRAIHMYERVAADGIYEGRIGGDNGLMLKTYDDGTTWVPDLTFPAISQTVTGFGEDWDDAGVSNNIIASTADLGDPTVPGRAFIWDNPDWTPNLHPDTWVELDNSAVDRGLLATDMNGAAENPPGNWGRNALFVGYDGRMYYNNHNTDVLVLTGEGETTEHLRACTVTWVQDRQAHVCGDNGTVLRVSSWVDSGLWAAGVTWENVSTHVGAGTTNLLGIASHIYQSDYMAICGENNKVFGTTAARDSTPVWADISPPAGYAGVTWLDCTFGWYQNQAGSDPLNGQDLFVLGDNGVILRATNFGEHFDTDLMMSVPNDPVLWVEERAATGTPLRCIFAQGNGDSSINGRKAWAVGDSSRRVTNLDYLVVDAWTEATD